ncbi:MAG: dihydrofolate reductase family protein [Ferruginibacter sp.]
MRKLKLQVQISIDGFIADENGLTDWLIWNWGNHWTWDKALQDYFIELTSSVDCVLLSRKMAEEGFIGHWAKVAEDKSSAQYLFAKNIASAQKLVFTKTLEGSTWANTELAKGDLTSEIKKLKAQRGKDMIVYGGASLVSSLIKAGLIDEYYLFVNPTILGDGKTVFKDVIDKMDLKLVSSIGYECGVTVAKYISKN